LCGTKVSSTEALSRIRSPAMTATLEKADEQGLQEHTMNVDLAMMGSGSATTPGAVGWSTSGTVLTVGVAR